MRTHPNSNVPCGATESDEDRKVAFAQCARCMLVLWERGGEEKRGERKGESGEESRTKKCWRVREGQDPSERWHIDSAATHLSGPGSDPLSLEAILGLSRERSLVSVVSARWGEARVKRGEGLVRRTSRTQHAKKTLHTKCSWPRASVLGGLTNQLGSGSHGPYVTVRSTASSASAGGVSPPVAQPRCNLVHIRLHACKGYTPEQQNQPTNSRGIAQSLA